jgi:hypothetical membrane protein
VTATSRAGDRELRRGLAAPWWGVVSSALAPVVLVTGWTVAAARQPGGFDPVERSISSLAAIGAGDRWIMTLALAVTGACHLVTAAALTMAAQPGRALLAAGGVATGLVATFPLGAGPETAHALAAGVAFGCLAGWPAFGWRRGGLGGPGLRPAVAAGAAVVLLGLVAWFAVELAAEGPRLGLAERLAAGAQSAWPFAAVLGTRRARPPES